MAVVPIQSLAPETTPPADRSIRGIVTLSWPYSSATKQCAFLIADADFRLRNRKGQVRVRFSGASAEAVAKSHVGIGDEMVLKLLGATWVQDVGQTWTPGKSVEGELHYARRLQLHIVRADGEVNVDVDAPTPPRSPGRIKQPAATETATPFSKAVNGLRYSLDGGRESVGTYSSPAFAKRLRLSGDSFLASPYDPFLEAGFDDGQPNKKQRLSFGGISHWRYAGRSPSPSKDSLSEMEVELQHEVPPQEGRRIESFSIDGTVEVPMSAPVYALPSMLPPPLPRLQMPDEAPATEQRSSPALDPRQENEPSTPMLQAIPNSALPLPSPFPTEAAHTPFAPTSSTAPTGIVGSICQEPATSTILSSAPAQENAAVELGSEDELGQPDEVTMRSSPDFVDTADARKSSDPSSQALAIEETTFDDGQISEEDAVIVAKPYQDSTTLPGRDDLGHEQSGLLATQETLRPSKTGRVQRSTSGSQPHTKLDEDDTQLLQTPAKTPADLFGLDGASTAAPAPQSTPQSEKDKVMARTFSSLFGFQSTETPTASLEPAPMISTTPSKAPPRASFGWFEVPAESAMDHAQRAADSGNDLDTAIIPAEEEHVQTHHAQLGRATEIAGDCGVATAEPRAGKLSEGEDEVFGTAANDPMAGFTENPDDVPGIDINQVTNVDDFEGQQQSTHASQDVQSQGFRAGAPVIDGHHDSHVMQPWEDAAIEDVYDADLHPPTEQHQSVHQASKTEETIAPASSTVEVIELGSSSDVEGEGMQDERLKEDDSQDIRTNPDDALPITVDNDARSSPPVAVTTSESEGPLLRSDEVTVEESLSSPLPTSQLDELGDELTGREEGHEAPMQPIAELSGEEELDSDQLTPRAQTVVSSKLPTSSPSSRQPRDFVRFPAERVLEDSQSEGRSGTLSTQPTPTAESFDVITVPEREPKSPRIATETKQERLVATEHFAQETQATQHHVPPNEAKAGEAQMPPPSTMQTEVIELGSCSPAELVRSPVEPTFDHVAQQGTEPMAPSEHGPVIDFASGNMLLEFSEPRHSAEPAHDRLSPAALGEADAALAMKGQVEASEVDQTEDFLARNAESIATSVSYPVLPLSPLQSQPAQESSTVEQTAQQESVRSALPPTPQPTQTAADMLNMIPSEVSQQPEDRDSIRDIEKIAQVSDRDFFMEEALARLAHSTGNGPQDVVTAEHSAQSSALSEAHVQEPQNLVNGASGHATAVATTSGEQTIGDEVDRSYLHDAAKDEELLPPTSAPHSTLIETTTPSVSTRPLRKTPRRSLRQSLSSVPDVLSKWFSPKRSSGLTHETPSKPRADAIVETADEGGAAALPSGQHQSPIRHAASAKTSTNGIITATSYFTPLDSLENRLNASSQDPFTSSNVDVMAVVTDSTTEPQRAKGGPRDYYNIFRIRDSSLISHASMRVEVFRPWKATLPWAEVGDVVLLRAFTVRSKKRQPYLLSTDASAWCVWRYAEAKDAVEEAAKPVWARQGSRSASGVTREEIKGPPVELGEEERRHAKRLHDWWIAMNGTENADADARMDEGVSSKLVSSKL